MSIVIISYADSNFKNQQKRLTRSAKKINKNYQVVEYGPSDIDDLFYANHKKILDEVRGGGYWLWKPYIIQKTLNQLNDGDYLFYCDSGSVLVNKIELLITNLEKEKQDIMGFELPLIESQWTKKELLLNLECDNSYFYNSNQLLASFILIKNTEESRLFVNEYLNACFNHENLTDYYDESIVQDISFIDHRHDQSIFSLLYKKNGYKPFRDPSHFGVSPEGYTGYRFFVYEYNKLYNLKNGRKYRVNKYYNSNFPVILYHIRKSNIHKFYSAYFLKRIINKVLQKLYVWTVRGRK